MKITKNILVVTVAMLASSAALADGWVCQDQNLAVKVYNKTQSSQGTRSPAVLVISNKHVAAGRKTIARFTDVNGRITANGARYVADVDLRYSDSGRKGELIGGTKLGELDTIDLHIAFSYAQPVEAGAIVSGNLTLHKRNGDAIVLDMECERYLKN